VENNTYTFWELIKKYEIEIPIIQRDYVQGRKSENTLRNNFLNAIYDSLKNDKELHLDFIYGVIKNNRFIPLDGQQRLTTLFLLHYYISLLDESFDEFQNIIKKDTNSKFSYEIRETSREFCNKLINEKLELSDSRISKSIKNKNWFFIKWEQDPTISSMLIMLDNIQDIFKKKNLFNRLKEKITFSFLEPKDLNIKNSDELYIKMNSRGKSLNEFENFKSKFIKFLPKKKKIDFDNSWFEGFWNIKKHTLKDDTRTIKEKENIIETEIFSSYLIYIKYITEMLAYKSGVVKEYDISSIDNIILLYENDIDKVNIRFLADSLDNMNIIQDSMKLFSNEYQKDKIAMLSDDNVFTKIITLDSNPSIFEKIILFMSISYIIKFKILDENFIDYIRVCRNILWNDGVYKKGEINFTQTLNTKSISTYIKEFNFLMEDQNIYNCLLSYKASFQEKNFAHEKAKAILIQKNNKFKNLIFKLEDYKYCKGNIANFLTDDIDKFEQYVNSVQKIFDDNDDSLIIRSLLSVDDYAIQIDEQWYGDKYFFGKDEYWHFLLTRNNKERDYKEFLQKYLDEYLNKGSFNSMINSYLGTVTMEDFRDYFVKYPSITHQYEYKYISADKNVFVFYKGDKFKTEKLNKVSIQGYHLNPFIYAVVDKLNLKNVKALSKQGKEKSIILIDSKVDYIKIDKDGWKIKFSSMYDESLLVKKFALNKVDTLYCFKEFDGNDRIESLVILIKEILK
jgi:hypothetical protein